MKLIGFVGSLRAGSYNRMTMRALQALVPQGVSIDVLEIGNLPLFNADLEKEQYPREATELKERIRTAEGIIIVTPEHNRSIPAALKNMLDWTTRPNGDNAWEGKKVMIAGASSGFIGTALAQYHLKQILIYLNASVMGQPEVYVRREAEKFDAQGNLTDEETKGYLVKALVAFVAFVSR